MKSPHYYLRWLPVGHRSDVAEGRSKLEDYQRNAFTPESFWFSEWPPAQKTLD